MPTTPERSPLRVAGIPVHIPWSGMVGVAIIAYLWLPGLTWRGAAPWATYAIAALFAILLYASVLLHELAHAFTARAVGFPVDRIVLWALGGYTVYERPRPSPGREAAIAASGPAATVAVALAFGAVARLTDLSRPWDRLVMALAFGNALLAAYNLLPGLPLDGGAIVRSLVWRLTGRESTGTVVAAWLGRGMAVVILLSPFALGYAQDAEPDLAVVLAFAIFASFMWVGATGALRRGRMEQRLPRLVASSLVRRSVSVPHDTPLAEALRRMHEAQAGGIVTTDHSGTPIGLVDEASVEATPIQRRPWVPVSSVSRTLDAGSSITQQTAGDELLEAIDGRSELLVVDEGGGVIGIVSVRDVEAALRA